MLLANCQRHVLRTWSQLNRLWKRAFLFGLAILLASFVSISLFWDAINEIPDRWHFPMFNPEPASSLKSPNDIFRLDPEAASRHHPINDLIKESNDTYERLLAQQTVGVAQAAQAYRKRRGRHPPPFFDQWVEFAEARGCLMIEEFFDRIHHDINPFWGISTDEIRTYIAVAPNYVRVRNGIAYRSEEKQPFMDSYFNLIQKIAKHLPDVDIPINTMDEPRVLVPWQTMAKHMNKMETSQKRQDLTAAPRINKFATLPAEVTASGSVTFHFEGPYWNYARQTCPPNLNVSALEVDTDFSTPPIFPTTYPHGTHSGFVRNWTTSQDFCHHPHLRNMHGTFVEPISISTSTSLIPIFSGSKLLTNNDILLPAAMYWTDEENFAASKHHIAWHKKRNEAFWRGTGSGGRNKVDNWTRFHRHRLVSMLNGTQVAMTLAATTTTTNPNTSKSDTLPHNFPLPNQSLYPLISTTQNLLPDWLRTFTNTAFYWLECFPPTKDYSCSYTGPWYRRGRPVPLQRMFQNKYLPDVDGNSFSGRFRAFMLSNSLPVKATLYTEWHDARLVPWRHFVPVDNTFVDLWSVFEFLFRFDETSERIALEGRRWAERVLRKEDMLVYVYRLVLEFARVCDGGREDMGFAGDLE